MKTNRKKIMVIGVAVTLLIVTNFVVSASYIQEKSTTNQLTTRAKSNDNKTLNSNAKNTPLDLLFGGVAQGHVIENKNILKTHRTLHREQTGVKSITHGYTPLDWLFNGSTLDGTLKTEKQISKMRSVSCGTRPDSTFENRQQHHATNKNTPLDLLFNGLTLDSAREKASS